MRDCWHLNEEEQKYTPQTEKLVHHSFIHTQKRRKSFSHTQLHL